MTATRRLARGDTVVLAPHNHGKLAEFARLLAPFAIAVRSAGSLGLAEPEETAPDFAGNALSTRRAAGGATGLPSLADDSGFGIAALDGAPGVLSARWVGPGKDYADAMRRLHALARPHADRRAFFDCALCLAWPDGGSHVSVGRVEGVWIWPPEGSGGFGYDPMFRPTGETASFAAVAPARKAAISHRGRAFASFAADCLPAAIGR